MAETETAPVAVVTGASEGIGRALAMEFARGGHAVALVARTESALEEAAREVRAAAGVDAHVIVADLATPDGCENVERELSTRGLHAEYLVNNAAMGLSGYFTEYDHGKLMSLVDLNIRALTDLTRRLLPGMVARDSGGVLNIASLGGFAPGPYQAAYYASKAYVISLSEALAHETAGTGVRVAVAAPGPVRTGFHRRMGSQNDYYIRFIGLMDAERTARIAYRNFMRGHRVIVPGLVNMLCWPLLRVTPHFLSVPFAAWLFKRRGGPDDA